MSRPAPTMLLALLGTAALCVSTLAGGITGVNRAAAQGGTPVATPTGEPSCTIDLGIVRSTKTCVNIVHASLDAPTVDVLVDSNEIVSELSYGTTSGFLNVPAGSHDVQIVTSGEGSDPLEMTFSGLELVAGRAYEVAVVGSLGDRAVVVNDVNVYAVEGTSQAGSTRIRLVNAAADVAAVNLDLIGGDIATRPISDVAGQRASDYTVIAAGTYQVRLTGTADGEELFHVPEFTFDRDTVTSLYAIGAASDGTLTILPVTTQASRLPAPATSEATPAA